MSFTGYQAGGHIGSECPNVLHPDQIKNLSIHTRCFNALIPETMQGWEVLQVFRDTGAAAALAAGIFHRREVAISSVKQHMHDQGIPTRLC